MSCGQPKQSEENETINIALLGQSLVRYDPRPFVESPAGRIEKMLAQQDIVFTNLECAICPDTTLCQASRDDPKFPSFPSPPEVLDYLESLHVNLLSTSNNHAWDFGDHGILKTLEEIEKRSFTFAGTGKNLQEASAPAYVTIKGVKIALVATSSASKLKHLALATDHKPGVNIVEMTNDADRTRTFKAVEEARSHADVVIFYQHLQGLGTPEEQEIWAKELVDHGVDIFVSHGDPRLYGIEVYKGATLFYGLGNFVFHTRSEVGHYEPEVWESVVVSMEYVKGRGLQNIRLIPVVLNEKGEEGALFQQTRGLPSPADTDDANRILNRLIDKSQKFGTLISIKEGMGVVATSNPE